MPSRAHELTSLNKWPARSTGRVTIRAFIIVRKSDQRICVHNDTPEINIFFLISSCSNVTSKTATTFG